ncbi:hypothetical protein GGR44_003220 [Sphingobium fontiphilum]|uniref:TraB/GumN family protein n=1 Tax=Sphingobium fontiphilum TaxID=944425 RepID=A0A7W6DJ25_9SPHN|nr:TraB/GumN family protein [Sphingobium fontiphilum]MBB3983529.1 hypothetical protein [Sphingobium fontiphilum]
MSIRKNARALAAALLLLAGAALSTPAIARAPEPARPALWLVQDADTRIYLFGTIHVLKPGIDWFNGPVRRAFDGADELVTEIVVPDDPQEMAAIMGQKALATDNIRLSDRLEPQARARYQAAMAANDLPVQVYDLFKPWMVAVTLSLKPLEKLGYGKDSGAEAVLTRAAKEAGKPHGALETVAEQIGFFDDLPMEQQVAFLNATVDDLPRAEADFGRMIDSWAKGRPDVLAKEMNESLETTPELADRLLTQRNARWAQWIKARLDRPGAVFVAVGAGHLAGKGSVQDQIKALKLRAKRVTK